MTMTSTDELLDVMKSTLIVALVFTIAYASPSLGLGLESVYMVAVIFLVCLVCAGLGFMLHEMMHKASASYFGYQTRYVGDTSLPLLSILLAFGGLILLSPGAVMVYGVKAAERRSSGIISLAGPATNLFLSLLFYGLYAVSSGFIGSVAGLGSEINAWLAFFNMLPVPGFDGAKVYAWSKIAFAVALLSCAAAAFLL